MEKRVGWDRKGCEMHEYFISANSFAAPFFSDSSTQFVEADTPEAALEKFAKEYKHPYGLFATSCYESADAYHKKAKPLAHWKSNHVLAQEAATKDKHGYSYMGHRPGDFEINHERIMIPDPKGGKVVYTDADE